MLAFADEYVPGPRANPVRTRIPAGFRFGGLPHPGSLDAPVLFSCAAAVILLLRAAWTGMLALALGMCSFVLGPVLLLFAGGSQAGVLFSADINAMPQEVLEYTVFITEGRRHIYELGDGLYIMHPCLASPPYTKPRERNTASITWTSRNSANRLSGPIGLAKPRHRRLSDPEEPGQDASRGGEAMKRFFRKIPPGTI